MTGGTRTAPAGRGEAGRRGADVRSDLWVAVEARARGGIEVDLESKVAPYYGESIEAGAREALARLAVEHARVEISDQGALPFVIAARIEAAARRAGLAEGLSAPPERLAQPGPSARDRLRRSRLYLPGNEPKYMLNAGLHEPDGIILDLEDSVHAAEKDAARLLVRNALRAVDFGAAERMVRINQLPLGLADLEEVIPEGPDMILIPKVEEADQVQAVDRRIGEILERTGVERPVWLMPIIESALGVENALAIARASERVAALTIGLEDFTADLGVPRTRDGAESAWARARLVSAARAAGLQAIDSVYSDVADREGLIQWGRRARGLGFEGMGCIHPRQIDAIHEAFAPAEAEIERALRIVAAFETAQERGLGVVSLGSKMIDPPVVERALKLVRRARAIGLIPDAGGGAGAEEGR